MNLLIIFGFFQVFTQQTFPDYDGTLANCNEGWHHTPSLKQAYALYLFTIIFAVPLLIVTFCYAMVIITLKRGRHPSDISRGLKSSSLKSSAVGASTKSLSEVTMSYLRRSKRGGRHQEGQGSSEESLRQVLDDTSSKSSRLVASGSKKTRHQETTARKRSSRRDEKRVCIKECWRAYIVCGQENLLCLLHCP